MAGLAPVTTCTPFRVWEQCHRATFVQKVFPRHESKFTPDGAQIKGALGNAGLSFVWEHYAEFWAPGSEKIRVIFSF
jgi:hypothetical protein